MDLFYLVQRCSKDDPRPHVPESPVGGNLSLESDPWLLFYHFVLGPYLLEEKNKKTSSNKRLGLQATNYKKQQLSFYVPWSVQTYDNSETLPRVTIIEKHLNTMISTTERKKEINTL